MSASNFQIGDLNQAINNNPLIDSDQFIEAQKILKKLNDSGIHSTEFSLDIGYSSKPRSSKNTKNGVLSDKIDQPL